jgi:hypothetical protein
MVRADEKRREGREGREEGYRVQKYWGGVGRDEEGGKGGRSRRRDGKEGMEEREEGGKR